MHRVDAYGILPEEVRNEFAGHKQTLRLLIDQRLEEHGIHNREDGAVSADADSERQDRDGSKTGIDANRAKRIPEILAQSIKGGKATLIAVAFLCRFQASELKPGWAAGFFRRDTAAHVFFH